MAFLNQEQPRQPGSFPGRAPARCLLARSKEVRRGPIPTPFRLQRAEAAREECPSRDHIRPGLDHRAVDPASRRVRTAHQRCVLGETSGRSRPPGHLIRSQVPRRSIRLDGAAAAFPSVLGRVFTLLPDVERTTFQRSMISSVFPTFRFGLSGPDHGTQTRPAPRKSSIAISFSAAVRRPSPNRDGPAQCAVESQG